MLAVAVTYLNKEKPMSLVEIPNKDEFLSDLDEYLTGTSDAEIANAVDRYALDAKLAADPRDDYLTNEARREVVLELVNWAVEARDAGTMKPAASGEKYYPPAQDPLFEGTGFYGSDDEKEAFFEEVAAYEESEDGTK